MTEYSRWRWVYSCLAGAGEGTVIGSRDASGDGDHRESFSGDGVGGPRMDTTYPGGKPTFGGTLGMHCMKRNA